MDDGESEPMPAAHRGPEFSHCMQQECKEERREEMYKVKTEGRGEGTIQRDNEG
jgi:hypothetical protein